MKSFTSIRYFSPAALILAILGFFLNFTDINCNGTTIDSVSGIEFVKGYNSDLDEAGNEAGSAEKYDPNIMLSIALLSAIAGLIFYFIKKMRTNYQLNAIVAAVGFLCMIGFMIDLKSKINQIDPGNNLDTEAYVNLEAEMKIGFWLVTACFLMSAVWNWMKGKESARHDSSLSLPAEDQTAPATDSTADGS